MGLLEQLRERWWKKVIENDLASKKIIIRMRPLKPEEAIGVPARREYPLLKGKEVMIQAEIDGAIGQAFTDSPTEFSGTLKDLNTLKLDITINRALLIAGINATYRLLNLIEGTKHCKNNGPEECAERISNFLYNKYGDVKIALIGFQPAIASHLLRKFSKIRVTDIDSENIGRVFEGITIESYLLNNEVMSWSDIILATGSTIVNNTIQDILIFVTEKPVYFYGVTVATLAYEFKLNRLCFNSL
ncbi:MAG: DUF364 domain-containing protein [Nitrososphaerota archaeon]